MVVGQLHYQQLVALHPGLLTIGFFCIVLSVYVALIVFGSQAGSLGHGLFQGMPLCRVSACSHHKQLVEEGSPGLLDTSCLRPRGADR